MVQATIKDTLTELDPNVLQKQHLTEEYHKTEDFHFPIKTNTY